MNEEIKFLREHIKDICSYKGLQEELTYDVPLDILKRVCIALDYLQQENKQLKDRINKTIEYIEENDNSELGINQTKFLGKEDLLEILKGDNKEGMDGDVK